MNSFSILGVAFAAIFLVQVNCAKIEVSVSVDPDPVIIPRFAVTEPAWVTELLGPTEAPITTKRPSLPDRIRNTIHQGIQQVGSTFQEIPNRINQIFQGIHNGANSIIRRPTTRPSSGSNATTTNRTSTVAPTKA